MERNIISQRVKSGMKNARAKGKQSWKASDNDGQDCLTNSGNIIRSIRLGKSMCQECEAVEMFESDDI